MLKVGLSKVSFSMLGKISLRGECIHLQEWKINEVSSAKKSNDLARATLLLRVQVPHSKKDLW